MSEKKVAGAGGGRKTRQSQGQPDFFKLQSLVEVQAVRMAEGAADRAKVWFQHRAGLSAPIQRALWDVTKKEATECPTDASRAKGHFIVCSLACCCRRQGQFVPRLFCAFEESLHSWTVRAK
eukprot:COSAG03_NODE_598_length_6798_cov_39.483654_7_plen_122_part_00